MRTEKRSDYLQLLLLTICLLCMLSIVYQLQKRSASQAASPGENHRALSTIDARSTSDSVQPERLPSRGDNIRRLPPRNASGAEEHGVSTRTSGVNQSYGHHVVPASATVILQEDGEPQSTPAEGDTKKAKYAIKQISLEPPEGGSPASAALQHQTASDGTNLVNRSRIGHSVKIELEATGHDAASNRVPKVRKLPGAEIKLASSDLSSTPPVLTFQLSEIANQGPITLELFEVDENDGEIVVAADGSTAFTLDMDTLGPRLVSAELADFVNEPEEVRLLFVDDDIADSPLVKEQFLVQRIDDRGIVISNDAFTPSVVFGEVLGRRRQQVRLKFDGKLPYGIYRITLPNLSAEPSKALKDRHGNVAGNDDESTDGQEVTLQVFAKRQMGERVEFPEFLPTAKQPTTERRLNPADKVETAVVRLYYFRDAHRVAQLVNRSVEPLNRAAVEQAEIRASKARSTADGLTRRRRAAEREAVRDAEELRRVENEIADARRQNLQLDNEEQRNNRQRQINNEAIQRLLEQKRASDVAPSSGTLPIPNEDEIVGRISPYRNVANSVWQDTPAENVPSAPAEDPNALPGSIEARINELLRENDRITARDTEIKKLRLSAQEAENSLAGLRNKAYESNEAALDLTEEEELARQEQFRLEVAAAHEDPDTYGAAELHSVDPVAQVSISVIGEGLIQLRGPSKGIDTIRTMIHQIDAPLGQVKVDVITVQVNGENGARMEGPVGKIDALLKVARGLTSHSLMLLRRAIQVEATRIATSYPDGHYQVDRDMRYMYEFFGRDFIDELYEMDSEFLNSENKILGIHSMDTISLHQALFVLALAKNDVRQRILANFMRAVRTDLVQAEFNMRRSAEIFPHKTRFWRPHHTREHREEFAMEGIALNNAQRYHFSHLMNFFGSLECGNSELGLVEGASDTLNPVQREFIRLAQIFKSRLVAELELKQRLIERTMIEDNVLNEINEEEIARNSLRPRVLQLSRDLQDKRLTAAQDVVIKAVNAEQTQSGIYKSISTGQRNIFEARAALDSKLDMSLDDLGIARFTDNDLESKLVATLSSVMNNGRRGTIPSSVQSILKEHGILLDRIETLVLQNAPRTRELKSLLMLLDLYRFPVDQYRLSTSEEARDKILSNVVEKFAKFNSVKSEQTVPQLIDLVIAQSNQFWDEYRRAFREFVATAKPSELQTQKGADRFMMAWAVLRELQDSLARPEFHKQLYDSVRGIHSSAIELIAVQAQYSNAKEFLRETRSSLEQRKLLDFLIQEQEEKVIDLLEGTRSRIAALDGYLKRLSVALEDDFQVQFYDPAFVRIRGSARHMDVTFGQVERTSVLTNNRAFAKVSPQATMEFDLPKRNIAIVEALDGAKALAQDYGALLQDPTFLAAYQMMGGAPSNGKLQNVIPGLPSTGDEQQMGFAPSPDQQSGSALQSLVPDPSIYKFETGTGFEIRPVIQPDGLSVVFDFNYMYTTNIREPVRADEKHLGRVKRHFINTQVQTTSFELRRVSRYQVALKAARTSQGVPLLQDIPVVGAVFRPAPSAESAIQENIILSQSVVYPTVFDIMGLRWAPSVVDLNHLSVRDGDHIVRGRQRTVKNSVFDETSRTVDEVLGLNRKDSAYHRPDLYRRQLEPSPYHPGGYVHERVEAESDPTGRGYVVPDRRPPNFQEPPYDRRRRSPLRYEDMSPASSLIEDQYEHVHIGDMPE